MSFDFMSGTNMPCDKELHDYMKQHDLDGLFKELIAALLFHMPARPLDYMSKVLGIIQQRLDEGSKDVNCPMIFNEFADLFCGSRRTSSASMHNYRDTHPTHTRESIFPDRHSFGNLSDLSSTCLMIRRGSVSAESLQPSVDEQPIAVIHKEEPAKLRIASAIRNNLLFRNLEDDQRQEVVDAMMERRVCAGEQIIVQGDEGDNFYVVDEGIFDIYINNNKVVDVGAGGSFGELALMYNTPRAATVVARTDALIWAVDRVTFRRTVMNNSFRKRKLYEGFLKTVPILQSLHPTELVRVADILEPVFFEDGDAILREGDAGDRFYLLVEGEATVTQRGKQVGHLHAGDYFGEIALITDSPRVATVTAKGSSKCVCLDTKAFIRLLGPCMDILKRNMEQYHHFESFMQRK